VTFDAYSESTIIRGMDDQVQMFSVTGISGGWDSHMLYRA